MDFVSITVQDTILNGPEEVLMHLAQRETNDVVRLDKFLGQNKGSLFHLERYNPFGTKAQK